MDSLKGKVVVVTGASEGIGAHLAAVLHSRGAHLSLIARNENKLAAVATAGDLVVPGDITDDSVRLSLILKTVDRWGRIDALINNAGLGSSHVDRPTITGATEAQYQLLLGVNLWGPIHLCRALVPHMRQAPRSDVIMVSSVAAQSMGARMGLYAIGKAGVEALAHTLAKEERAHGRRVNIVAPGLVDTDMGRKLMSTFGVDNIRDRDATAPFGFVCTPDDIAATIAFLCSEDGRYITNERITVSGGGF